MKLLTALLTVALAAYCRATPQEPGVGPAPQTPPPSEAPTGAQSTDSAGVQAAPEEPAKDSAEESWRFLIKPYFFAYGLEGTVSTGRSVNDIDAEFTDLFDSLNFGGMLTFEARPPASKWTLMTDLMYVAIEEDGTSKGLLGANVDTTLDQFIGELSVAYELLDEGRLELLGGVRYWNIDADLQVALPTPMSASGSVNWLDPLVGVRSSLGLGSSFDLMLRGDIGGFGVGSDFTYNVAAEVGWSLSELLQIALGYRYLYVDYEDDVTYDMAQAGPVLGLAFRF